MQNDKLATDFYGEDVEAAIATGLRELGLRRDQVNIEIVDEGRKGFLGLGGREAVVRLTPITSPAPTPVTETTTPTPEPMEELSAPIPEESGGMEEADTPDQKPADMVESDEPVELDEHAQVAMEVVEGLLAQMQIQATIEVQQTPADDLTGRRMLVLNITGDDEVGRLIGARGEVLNDFQYIARLMAAHTLQSRVDFLIDVNGYRQDRQTALASLARRMAQKAARRGQPVTLEPMSPYDRRIIHMTLRDENKVYTQSTGEGNRRRVRIYPKGYAGH